MQLFKDWHSEEIEGYISHTSTEFGAIALLILYFIYNREMFWKESKEQRHWYHSGWRSQWWKPRNWVKNLFHVVHHRSNAIPFHRWHKDVRQERNKREKDLTIWKREWNHFIDGIPF